MRNLLPLVVVLVAAILLRNSPASAKVTDDQIQAAIDQGVEGLLASQNEKGLWSAAAMGPYEFSIIMSRRRTNRFGKIQALEGAGV